MEKPEDIPIYILRWITILIVFSITTIFTFNIITIAQKDYKAEKTEKTWLANNTKSGDGKYIKIPKFSFFAVANAVEMSPEFLAKKAEAEKKEKELKKRKRKVKSFVRKDTRKYKGDKNVKGRKEIIKYIKTKGWDHKIAIAVAMAESGMNENIKGDHYNREAPKGSWGIFQINIAVHKKLIGKRNIKNYKENIDIAYQIYKQAGNRWRPWGAYTDGNYKKFLK